MRDETITVQEGPISRVKLILTDTSLSVHRSTLSKPEVHHEVGYRYILRATFDNDSLTLKVAYLAKKKKQLHLVIVEGTVEQAQTTHAEEWVESVMKAAYDVINVKRSRRLMVLVNPFGGTKKGASIFVKKVEPVLKAAGCTLEVLYTTHKGQAQEVAKTLPLIYDAVITVSGDGLVHEILNGFAEHADPVKAFSTPVAPVPTGSGNGLSLNLLGIEEGFDVLAAALNAVKGQPMKVDLFSFQQGGKQSISFMSQALGLMADLDLGTEHLRWMGETRFFYGLLRGFIKYKSIPIEFSYKLAESDKHKMAFEAASRNYTANGSPMPSPMSPSTSNWRPFSADESPMSSPVSPSTDWKPHNLVSPMSPIEKDDEGWTTFPHPILYLYGGKGPYVGRDYMAFPVSLPDDGLVDLVLMTNHSRGDLFSAMDGAPEGASYWHPKVHYVKAHSYRIRPLQKKGYLAIDGEPFPFEEYQVDVLQGLGTLLSPYGRYAAKFEPRPPESSTTTAAISQ